MSRGTKIDPAKVFEEATTSVYSADNLGHAGEKWMDRNTYMLRMNVQRALGINWSGKVERL